ncbi:transmembrane protein 134 isoform X1 [Sorex araneus]|uniref:transmembrane protein 134 isoform X1 n=1 Tax=Sorex araneus TaxID=42254 RepID=UPI0024337BE8|nr:transmembrane protein 134 isoform X1 [Sorex araneus]
MSSARPQFSIDDAFDLSLEDAGPGPESSGVARFGPLHFDRRARFEVTDEEKQSGLRYQNLENDEDGAQASPEPDAGASTRDSDPASVRGSQWSFSTLSTSTQRSYRACCSWVQHPLVQKNHRVVLASFLLLLLGLGVFAQATAGRQLSWASEGGVWPGQLLLSGREPSGLTGAGLVPSPALTLATPRSVDPDRRGTGGGPQPRCLQCHILRAWLPAAGPWSLPRDLHLLRCPGSSGLPVLLPALLREVS